MKMSIGAMAAANIGENQAMTGVSVGGEKHRHQWLAAMAAAISEKRLAAAMAASATKESERKQRRKAAA
jgi:hypothetical protein